MQCGSSTMGRGMGSRRTQQRWGGWLNRLECHPPESGEPWKVFKQGSDMIPFINYQVLCGSRGGIRRKGQ